MIASFNEVERRKRLSNLAPRAIAGDRDDDRAAAQRWE
jgi:hypothetical protein